VTNAIHPKKNKSYPNNWYNSLARLYFAGAMIPLPKGFQKDEFLLVCSVMD
jgi:hypothetical protein